MLIRGEQRHDEIMVQLRQSNTTLIQNNTKAHRYAEAGVWPDP